MLKPSLFFRRILCLLPAVFLFLSVLPGARAAQPELIGGEDSGIINILLIGQDLQEDDICRSDSMILCTFCPETTTITLTSFLRDLYVPIPGKADNRINAAYAIGGSDLLRRTLEETFGVCTDGVIEVDFSQFSGIIDILGGVTIDLRQDEAEVLNRKTGSDLTQGRHLLTGEQALAYSRIRNLDGDGDFSRTARQRNVLTSLLDSYRSAGFLKVLSAVMDTLPLITTDLEKKEILLLATKLFPFLQDPTVVSQRLPADGTYTYQRIRGMEVLVADMEKLRQQLRQSLLPPENPPEQ